MRRLHLDLPGREIGVRHVRRPGGHLAFDLDHRLARQAAGDSSRRLWRPRPHGDLDDPGAVAQVDEHDAPEVAAAMHPSAEPDALAHVLCAQIAAPMRAAGGSTHAVYGTSD